MSVLVVIFFGAIAGGCLGLLWNISVKMDEMVNLLKNRP